MDEIGRPASRPSSIDELDEQIRELITELRVKKRWPIAKIRKHLLELGEDISQSALARHTRKLDEQAEKTAEKMRIAREMSKIMAKSGDPGEDVQLARLNAEMYEVGLFNLLTDSVNGKKPLAPGLQMQLGIAIDKSTTIKERLQKIDERADKRAADKLKAKLTEMAKKPGSGLTKETVDQIYHAVLGVQS